MWLLELALRTPTLCSVWPLELWLGTATLCCGPSSWSAGLPPHLHLCELENMVDYCDHCYTSVYVFDIVGPWLVASGIVCVAMELLRFKVKIISDWKGYNLLSSE